VKELIPESDILAAENEINVLKKEYEKRKNGCLMTLEFVAEATGKSIPDIIVYLLFNCL